MKKSLGKVILSIFLVLLVLVLLFYRQVLIKLTLDEYIRANNLQTYTVDSVEKYPQIDGYLASLTGPNGEERRLTIISTRLPVNIIHDSMVDKENLK